MNTQAMINKLNKQYELRLNNTVKIEKVKFEDLKVNDYYILNNGYCIMHCVYIGCVDDISENDDLKLYEFEFTKKDGYISITKETLVKWLYEIKVN